MSQRQIPNLVFATRSPDPRSGSDFVRQVVAESPGVTEAARGELSRRADIAGAVLQSTLERPVYFFSPLAEGGGWLFARAVSLGLYRKGSQHLLVHGLVLDEEILEWLEGNPFLLDLPELGAGTLFCDRHPGREDRLPPLALEDGVLERARELNRRRLAELTPRQGRWLPAAYDALAAGDRLACVAAEPRPEPIEWLLLHFHPDDRLELSFQTFYSHSRPVPYRLVGLVPEDLSLAQGHFRGLVKVGVAEAEGAGVVDPGIGRLAGALAARSPDDYLALVDKYRLTYLSRRKMPPLAREDAAAVLAVGSGEAPTAVEKDRLLQLSRRGTGGLGFLISELAGTWSQHPESFDQQLERTASVEEKLTAPQLLSFLETLPSDFGDAERFALLSLLSEERALAPPVDWDRQRHAAWERLVPASRLRDFLASFSGRQLPAGIQLVERYAIDALVAGEPSSWHTLAVWLADRELPFDRTIDRVAAALAAMPARVALDQWRRVQDFLLRRGHRERALQLALTRELPLLEGDELAERARQAIAGALADGGGLLPELADQLQRPAVAEALFLRLAAALAAAPRAARLLSGPLRRLLDGAGELAGEPEVARAAGRFLARWELARGGEGPGASPSLAALLDRCRELLPQDRLGERHEELFPGRALAAAADELVAVSEMALDSAREERLIAAAAACLDARGRYPRAAGADRQLMNLAVVARVLARHRSPDGGDATARLEAVWSTFLSTVRQGELWMEPPAEARWWHALLRDELTAEPPTSESDQRFDLYLRLGWALWGGEEPGSRYRAALALRLRRATRLIQKEKKGRWIPRIFVGSENDRYADWYFDKLQQLVPLAQRDEAERLLRPIEIEWKRAG